MQISPHNRGKIENISWGESGESRPGVINSKISRYSPFNANFLPILSGRFSDMVHEESTSRGVVVTTRGNRADAILPEPSTGTRKDTYTAECC